jgi:glutamyl-tRNA synthetase
MEKSRIEAYALKNAVEHEGRCQANSVLNSLFACGLKKEDIKKIMPEIQEIVKKVNAFSVEEQKKKFLELENEGEISHREVREEGELPELENAEKNQVIMRIAPYPSGPLHIGNTRQLILNDEYAKKYMGKLLFVIDDTIGSEEKQIAKEAYDLIPQGADWLDVEYERPIIYKSDRLEIYYKYAEEIIKKDKAYVCSCSQELLRENRKKGKECWCRKQKIEENLKLWKEMFFVKEGKTALRIKTSMKYPNPAFRDRVIFRICDREHARVGKKYRVWPLLDFSWAIDDKLLGMTHIIRGKELMIETDMERFIFEIFGWKEPVFIHTGLFQFEGVKLSKSKGQKEVKEGRYIGWQDPRTWSVQSLQKRGFEPSAIRRFIISQGLTKGEVTVPIDSLYAMNRKIIKEKANWASFEKLEKKSKNAIEVLMPDAKAILGKSDLNQKNLKDGDIVYFKGFGFCRFNFKEKIKFWFCHE